MRHGSVGKVSAMQTSGLQTQAPLLCAKKKAGPGDACLTTALDDRGVSLGLT